MEKIFSFILWCLMGLVLFGYNYFTAKQIKAGKSIRFEKLLVKNNFFQYTQKIRKETAQRTTIKGVIVAFLYVLTLSYFYLPSFDFKQSNNQFVLVLLLFTSVVYLMPVSYLSIWFARRKDLKK
ncbi:hypothetical protein [Enterococcus timonensis]|uniref:hypothetical protein n=1 Tax=Enterococcus timonensis TaxID=1852364 RepID=UPI0008D936DA|nr:hypothetical protein [Enterococcus timonensis]